MSERLLRTASAARVIGVHPQTLRAWTRQGRVPCARVGPRNERRYREVDLRRIVAEMSGEARADLPSARAICYLRVSGSTGQETSLVAQESELRMACARDGVDVLAVISDRASGLNERRVGLLRVLALVAAGEADQVRVTHADRLARFGVEWLRSLLLAGGATLVVEHPTPAGEPTGELIADFMALLASFSGRLYGQRSAAARRRLLAEAAGQIGV